MKNLCNRILMIEWNSIGWIFALLSGYIVTTAYEVSELIKFNRKVTMSFVIQKFCALVVVFFLGYLLRSQIKLHVKSEDLQAGVFACVGGLGFSIFGIIYRIFTNRQAWTDLFFTFARRWIGENQTGYSNQPKKPDNNDAL